MGRLSSGESAGADSGPSRISKRGDEAPPALGLLVQLRGQASHAAIAGIRGQDTFVGLDHALGLAEPVASDVGHALEGARAQTHVGGTLGKSRKYVAQVVPCVAHGIERFERVDFAGLRIGLAQGAQHARILGLGRVYTAQSFKRRLSRTELLQKNKPTSFEQGAAFGAALAPSRLGQAHEDLGQGRPALFALVKPGQRGHRRTVAGRQFKHLVPQTDGLAQIGQPLGRQHGHFHQVRAPRIGIEKGAARAVGDPGARATNALACRSRAG